MFDFIRSHTRVLFFILIVLIIPSFVFFGLDGYTRFREEGNRTVAHVGGVKITQAELDAAHREQVERMRRQNPSVDLKGFDSPAMKAETLDGMIRDRLLLMAAEKLHLVTTDERMTRIFREDPQLAFVRRPDGSLNRDVLVAQGLSPETFELRLRQDISSRQVTYGIEGSVLAPAAVASAGLDAFYQQREVQIERFDAERFKAQVKPTDADLEAYYKDPVNAARYRTPEQATVEYVVLDLEALKKEVSVPEDDLRRYYTENERSYTAPEERRASHILVQVEASASADVKAKAKAKAESLLAEARKNPAGFADLARKNSDDPGSAQNGGDLDFFGRGAMVKPFEEAAFALKPGEISNVVTSDFGFHIIQVTGARGGEKRSFESVRKEIEERVRKELAQKRFSEIAAEFGNTVFEQADSLKPVAEKFKLELRTAKGVTRVAPPGAPPSPLTSPKLLEALFSNDVLRNKRNTDAIETAANQLAAARVVEYSPAQTQPLQAVRDQVLAQVTARQAAALARKEGEAKLALLKSTPATAMTAPPITISRVKPGDLPPSVVDAALNAPAQPLPSAVGVDLGDQGYAVLRVTKVLGRDPDAGDAKRNQEAFARSLGEAEAVAYYTALQARFKVDREAAVKAVASAASAAN